MSKIKCPNMFCRSKDVSVISTKERTSLNLNPLRPFTLFNHKDAGKAKFRCNKCGKIFTARI